jgi:hypothetical protein
MTYIIQPKIEASYTKRIALGTNKVDKRDARVRVFTYAA